MNETQMTSIMNMMLPLIPDDYKTELMNDIDLAGLGLVEMCMALGREVDIAYQEEVLTGEDGTEAKRLVPVSCSPALTLQETYIASHYAYRAYLMRLKDEFNRDAINFKTLTFEIKSLEKRPEAINDTLYTLNRYLDDLVAQASGAKAILGNVTMF